LVARADLHWLSGNRVNVNNPVSSFLQAVGYGTAIQPPLADE
jgi:hypothetical protein